MIQLSTKADIEASIPNFERAIELDPELADAHGVLVADKGFRAYFVNRAGNGQIPLSASTFILLDWPR